MRTGWRVASLSLFWLTLGGWVGAMLLFSVVVAPAAFRNLPSSELAGQVIGPVLGAIHLYGAAAGIVIAILTLIHRQGLGLALFAGVLSALCLVSHFGVSAWIAELRDAALGPESDPTALARFGFLHRVSVAIFSAVTLGAIVLMVLHARRQVRSQTPDTRTEFS